jgi:hypothetical protein
MDRCSGTADDARDATRAVVRSRSKRAPTLSDRSAVRATRPSIWRVNATWDLGGDRAPLCAHGVFDRRQLAMSFPAYGELHRTAPHRPTVRDGTLKDVVEGGVVTPDG